MWQGWANPQLSVLGRRQAIEASRWLSRTPVGQAAIVSSDLTRAMETASIMAEHLDLSVSSDFRLRERHMGQWSGLRTEEIKRTWPRQFSAYRKDDPLVTPPGGEDTSTLLRRALDSLTALARRAGAIRTTIVITHGGLIRTVERHLGVTPPEGPVPNLGGRWILARVDGTLSDAGIAQWP